jgi:hypothetical protein
MKHRDQHTATWSFSLRLEIGEADPIGPRAPKESDRRKHTMSFAALEPEVSDADFPDLCLHAAN